MKKNIKMFFIIAIIICIIIMLIYDRDEISGIKGTVVSSFIDTNTNQTQLVMINEQEKQVYISIDDNTSINSCFEHPNKDDIINGDFKNIKISVLYNQKPTKITNDDGVKTKIYHAKSIMIEAVLTENVKQLSDGTWIDMWDLSSRKIFCLKNGKELLCETNPLTYVSDTGIDYMSSLSPEAQQNINTYFSSQWLLYDLDYELEKSYTIYKEHSEEKYYYATMLSQNIYQAYSTDKLIYFITEIVKPLDYQEHDTINIGTAFNKETGEIIPNSELFCVPKETAIKAILDASKISDTSLKNEIKTAFNFDNIIFNQTEMIIIFPAGSLTNQEIYYTMSISLEYSDIKDILYDWAIPKQI